MSVSIPDPFVDDLDTRVVEVSAQRAVVEQPALPHLGNHVGVRHASALHAAANEACRALVLAAAKDHDVSLLDSEIAFTQIGLGLITTVAEPSGPGWEALAQPRSGEAELTTNSVSRNEQGRTVATFQARWCVRPVSA